MTHSIIVVGPGGGLDFNTARTFIIHNWDEFCNLLTRLGCAPSSGFAGTQTFGSTHNWHAFNCSGGCGRTLPIDCSDLDHMSAKTHIPSRVTHMAASVNLSHIGGKWTVGNNGKLGIIDYGDASVKEVDYSFSPPSRQITFPTRLKPGGKAFDIIDVLACDVTNLQPLCPLCNRTKGASK